MCFLSTEKYTPQRSGLRERKRPESPKNTEPSVTETWRPEEELELWEIKQFGEKYGILDFLSIDIHNVK